MSKKKLTKADLGKTLAELGFKEGDELLLPSKKPKSNEQSESNEGTEDDGGIEVPKKPPPPQP